MTSNEKFRCPVCGFEIFNRRLANCESCHAVLPAELLFTPEEVARIEADHASNTQVREKLAREAAELEALQSRRGRGGDGGDFV